MTPAELNALVVEVFGDNFHCIDDLGDIVWIRAFVPGQRTRQVAGYWRGAYLERVTVQEFSSVLRASRKQWLASDGDWHEQSARMKKPTKPKIRRYITASERRQLSGAVINHTDVILFVEGVAYEGRLTEFSVRTNEAVKAVVTLRRELP